MGVLVACVKSLLSFIFTSVLHVAEAVAGTMQQQMQVGGGASCGQPEAAPMSLANVTLGQMARSMFYLDPQVAMINHGSRGATPAQGSKVTRLLVYTKIAFSLHTKRIHGHSFGITHQNTLNMKLHTLPVRFHQQLMLELVFCMCPVLQAQAQVTCRMEQNPDRFFLRDREEMLRQAAGSLAQYVGCEADDVSFVVNATTGVNCVMRSLDLQEGDDVVCLNLAYHAVSNTLRFICYNLQKMVELKEVNVQLPLKDFASLTEMVMKAVRSNQYLQHTKIICSNM